MHDGEGEVEMGTPGSDGFVALRFVGREAVGGGERFVRDGSAVNPLDDREGEAGDGGCQAEGVELIGALGEVEDEDLLELRAHHKLKPMSS